MTAQERKADEEQRHYGIARVLTTSLLPSHCEFDIARVTVRTHPEQKSIRSTRLTLSVLLPTSKKHSDLLLVSSRPAPRISDDITQKPSAHILKQHSSAQIMFNDI